MLLIIRIIVLLLLVFVFVQDIIYRAVTWYLFPLLAVGLLLLHFLSAGSLRMIWPPVLINTGFISTVVLLLSFYLSWRHKRWVNINTEFLGWGDVLFLGVVACYLSVLNFLFFYLISLICILFLWISFRRLTHNKYIPLAGFQSLIFIVFLTADWWYFDLPLTDDYWLLRFFIPWT